MAKRDDGRTRLGRFSKGISGNPSGVKRRQDSAPRSDDWSNFFTGQGIWGRDKRVGTHFQTVSLAFDQLKDLWLGDDLAARAVETIPKEAMRQGYDLVISSAQDNGGAPASSMDPGELANEVTQKLELLGADDYLEVAGNYERGYGGGAILIGANDGQEDMTQPLNLNNVKSLDWLTPLEARELLPLYAYADPRAPKYGQPEIYQLQSRAVLPSYGGNYASTTMMIHESRLLIFPGIRVSRYQQMSARGGWGEAVLSRVYRVLRDFNTAWSSAGVLVTDFAQSVIKIAGLWEALALDGGKAFTNRLNAMELGRSSMNAITIDAGDSYERQQTPLSGLPDLLEKFAVRLAAACDMPLTLLFGTSPAGMNATGESDVRFFYDRVAAYQRKKILPQLRRLIQIIFRTIGNKREPDKWVVKFRPLWQESAKDKAQAMLIQAQADTAWITATVLSADEVAKAHWGKGEYDPNLSVDFEARESMERAAPPPVGPQPGDGDYVPKPGEEGYVPPPGAGTAEPVKQVPAPGPAAAADPNTPPKNVITANVDRFVPFREDGDWNEEDHPRGEGGKFGAGSHSEHKSTEELAAAANRAGGFTYDPEHGGMPKEGYALSIHQGHEHVIKATELTPAALREYLDKHGDFIKANPGAHVGAWYDKEAGKWYLDVSHVTHSRTEAEHLAKANNQEAFYDLAKHETVYVKSGNARRIDASAEARRRQEAALRPVEDDRRGDGRGDEGPRGRRQVRQLDDIGPEYIIQQLEEDFPESAMGWVRAAHWQGPEQVPLDDVDFSNVSSWRAAHEPEKVAKFKKRIAGGWLKPVVLVKRPGLDKMMIADGHHRALAYRALGRPIMAFVAHVASDKGPWDEFHSAQHENEHVGEDGGAHNDGPSWAADPDIWAKAEEAVDPEGDGAAKYEDPWAVVASVYEKMGGTRKDEWSDAAREAALEARRNGASKQAATAHGHAAHAKELSKKAKETGKAEDHRAAARAHEQASRSFERAGKKYGGEADKHSEAASGHREHAPAAHEKGQQQVGGRFQASSSVHEHEAARENRKQAQAKEAEKAAAFNAKQEARAKVKTEPHKPQGEPAEKPHEGKHGGEHAPGGHEKEGLKAIEVAKAAAEIIGGKEAGAVAEGVAGESGGGEGKHGGEHEKAHGGKAGHGKAPKAPHGGGHGGKK